MKSFHQEPRAATHVQAKETLTTEQFAELEELLQRRCHHKGKQ